ncbi:hypothetical protein LSAT2_018198 [Lamellibrachia satsuma]|nr:hypothetical protein LSAT2_018198 [Lamellibrachia satsuma]
MLEGRRKVGRPKTTWRSTIENERRILGWNSWNEARRVAADRASWRRFASALWVTGPEEDSFVLTTSGDIRRGRMYGPYYILLLFMLLVASSLCEQQRLPTDGAAVVPTEPVDWRRTNTMSLEPGEEHEDVRSSGDFSLDTLSEV